jgi:Zn-finger nucleic acid-binding protein
MNCPRCETTLETYTLGDHDADVCERCGYVGVSVEHESERMEMESWSEALRRFHDQDAE